MPPRTLFSTFCSPFFKPPKYHPTNRPVLPAPSLRTASQFRRPQPRFSRTQQLRELWFTSPGFRYGIVAAGLGGGTFYVYNLERVPVSGRLRFNCIPAQYEEQMAQDSLSR